MDPVLAYASLIIGGVVGLFVFLCTSNKYDGFLVAGGSAVAIACIIWAADYNTSCEPNYLLDRHGGEPVRVVAAHLEGLEQCTPPDYMYDMTRAMDDQELRDRISQNRNVNHLHTGDLVQFIREEYGAYIGGVPHGE